MLRVSLAISGLSLLAAMSSVDAVAKVAEVAHFSAGVSLPRGFDKWANVKTPTSGPARIHGGYSAGCISGAAQLPVIGSGFQVVHSSKNRYYAHSNLTYYIQDLGYRMKKSNGLSIAIEDLSFPRGGPFFTGHSSHQIGLDADISLQLISGKLNSSQSESWLSPSYVQGRKHLKSNWTAAQADLTALAANSPYVNRIFVSPAIKKYFCDTTPSAPWLYKLRAWWGHDDHLHVRLSCPKDSPNCESQPALNSKDNGCGGDLAWWYSAEADAEWAEMIKPPAPGTPVKPKPYPTLPAKCEALVRL